MIKIEYYTEEQTEQKFDEIMDKCFTLSRAEILNLGQLIVSTCRSRWSGEGDNAARKVAGFRAILDFLFESKRIENEIYKKLHTLTGYVMGFNHVI